MMFSPKKLLLSSLMCLIYVVLSAQKFDTYSKNDGVGLYFEKSTPKHGSLKLVWQKEISNDYRFAIFYENHLTHKLYLKNGKKIAGADEIKITPASPTVGRLDDPITRALASAGGSGDTEVEKMIATLESYKDVYENNDPSVFIKQSKLIPGLVLEMPQHHLAEARLQAMSASRPNFKLDLILKKLNGLGLERFKKVPKKSGDTNTEYDRLFINDEDENQLLVIWLSNNQVFANFLSNSGEWLFAEPKIIHKEVICHDGDGKTYERNLNGNVDLSTLITELNAVKWGHYYYVGYSLNSWQSGPCLGGNIATCHLLRLNKGLDVEKAVQIPSAFTSDSEIFAIDFQMKIYANRDTICAVIQSPNSGSDKLFVQNFDHDLNPLQSLHYLTCTSDNFSDLVPVLRIPNGFLLTYKEKKNTSIDFYTQFIDNLGTPSLPVKVYTCPHTASLYPLAYHVQKTEQGKLFYHFVIKNNKTDKTYLYKYETDVTTYFKQLNYKINLSSWKTDPEIVEIDKFVQQTDQQILNKVLSGFGREASAQVKKQAYTNKSLDILKYIETKQESAGYQKRTSVYYNTNQVIRMIRIDFNKIIQGQVQPIVNEKYLLYYTADGKLIWQVYINSKGEAFTEDIELALKTLLSGFDLSKPFEEFHK